MTTEELRDLLADYAREFARVNPAFGWREGESVKVVWDATENGAEVFTVHTPAAVADVAVQPSGKCRIAVQYTHRCGYANDPRPDDELHPTDVQAEDAAVASCIAQGGVWAVWPIGRDVFHPDALAFEGFLYRRVQ